MLALSLLLLTVVGEAATDLYVTEASLQHELGLSASPPLPSPTASRFKPEEYGSPGIALARTAEEPSSTTEDGDSSHHHGGGYKIVQWEWSYVQTPFIIAIWLLVSSVAKIRQLSSLHHTVCNNPTVVT